MTLIARTPLILRRERNAQRAFQLEEDESTVATFKQLHAKHSELAKKCFSVVQQTLLEKDEVELFTHYAGD